MCSVFVLCSWDVDESEFQAGLMNDLIRTANLKSIAVYTSYTVTSTE